MSPATTGHALPEPYGTAGLGDVVERQKLLRVRGRSVAWVPPLVLLAAIAVADYNTTGEFRIISWIVLVPGIAAALCGVWGTAVFSVLSMAAYTLVDNAWPHQFQAGSPTSSWSPSAVSSPRWRARCGCAASAGRCTCGT